MPQGHAWNHFHSRLDHEPDCEQQSVSAFFLPIIHTTEGLRLKRYGVYGLLLQRVTSQAGIYSRMGMMWLFSITMHGVIDGKQFPEWYRGTRLEEHDFLSDLGDGRYKFEIQ